MAFFLSLTMTIWAYGTIVVKDIINLNAIQINLYTGIFMTVTSGLLYPIFVSVKQPLFTMFIGLFLCGLPMAVGNLIYVYALTINKNTGIATLCITSSVFIGYILSIFRYHEQVNYICLLGSVCIVLGLAKSLMAKKD